MTHLNEDQLLEYALEIYADEKKRRETEAHLRECPQCRTLLSKIKSELEFIGSIRPRVTEYLMPFPKQRESFLTALLRTAALLILGACLGFGIAGINRPESVCVMPAYNIAGAPAALEYGPIVSEATVVRISYSAGN